MKSIYLLTILCLSSLFAVEIDIKVNSDSYQATPQEVALLQEGYLHRRIQINNDDAANVIQENRYLSQEYLKKHKVPSNVMINMKLEFEKYLAASVVKEMESKIKIEDDVSKSYYVVHKDEFYQPKKIDVSIYHFDDFNTALKFYDRFKENQNELVNYVKDNNISMSEQQVEFPRLNRMFQDMITYGKQKAPFILPPQFFYQHYSVVFVKSITQSGIKPFEDVKASIEKKLHRQALEKMKKELLKPYKKAEEAL